MNTNSRTGGVGIGTVLLCIFITLKLTGNIDWSWWWVLSPLWITLVVFLVCFVFIFGYMMWRDLR